MGVPREREYALVSYQLAAAVPAQDRGLGFDVGPLLEPAVQALLLALLQVLPQVGQGAAGVQLGYRVECLSASGRDDGGRLAAEVDHLVRLGRIRMAD
jgi:hypothetical protein